MKNVFQMTIQELRYHEEVLLFDKLAAISDTHANEVAQFLYEEYQKESINYPGHPPSFDKDAALWAAKTFYASAQLILNREMKVPDLPALLPAFQQPVTAAAMLSADLVLRFLPQVIDQLKLIDPEDRLIAMLENHLTTWHYSGIGIPLPIEALNMQPVLSNSCLLQLYLDRVIEKKQAALANHPQLVDKVKAVLGMHTGILWNGFKAETTINNEQH